MMFELFGTSMHITCAWHDANFILMKAYHARGRHRLMQADAKKVVLHVLQKIVY